MGNIQDVGYAQFTVVGRSPDIDGGDPPVDVWDIKGIYPFPPVALPTTVVSSDLADSAAGLGAQRLLIFGLDKDFLSVNEKVELNGTTPVLLATQFLRINRIEVIRAGEPLETNQGIIDVLHGATVISRILPGVGQSQQAIFTIPDDYDKAILTILFASINDPGGANVVYAFEFKPAQTAWRKAVTVGIATAASTNTLAPASWIPLPRKTDIRLRVSAVSSNNVIFTAGFQLVYLSRRIPQL